MNQDQLDVLNAFLSEAHTQLKKVSAEGISLEEIAGCVFEAKGYIIAAKMKLEEISRREQNEKNATAQHSETVSL